VTNQRVEINAALVCLQRCVSDDEDVQIFTDSNYLLQAATDWRFKWMKNGWNNSKDDTVENQDLLRPLFDLIDTRSGETVFTKVAAHSDVYGNEMADQLAVAGSNTDQS
jgi:ribonuclease HI